ncbi:tripartite-type tricarboxylate transporter receptor subunit TctC [Acidovorax soli]|uniref:Tripartite-type tricarboxylate transporter receptor subunit TctC n=1 Tax=Acidovorax soli TaxID=592050 RepID=A0A7X0UCK5_9BURK|nr:tripartite tricarboxylate transporter substrate-binding protein [Acidovorax soli]MBB6563507.1 tripartite-type tricarboxylate transporter receptor subunit TctC [Acidovorax soli]
MDTPKRSFVRYGSAVALAFATGGIRAQSYPSKPLQWVVAFAPGGAGDIVARLVAQKLGEGLGQPVVVENRPAPVAAASLVKHARPDGHTLLMAGSGTALTSALFTKLPYDLMGDFTHVSTLSSFDLAFLGAAASDLRSVADVIAFAKTHPGKLNIGSARVGSTQNLAAEMFRSMAGIDALIVPYKTTSDLVSAIRSRDVHVAIDMLPVVLSQIHAGAIKPLAVTSARRFAGLSHVPTVAESGLAGFEVSSWNGIAVPAATPQAVVTRLAREIATAVGSPQVRKALLDLGAEAQASTPEQMAQRMRSDIAKWRSVIDRAAIPRQ